MDLATLSLVMVLSQPPAIAEIGDHQHGETRTEQMTTALLAAKAPIAMFPLAATIRCLTREQCREVNPVMSRVFGRAAEGWRGAVAIKASAEAAGTYLLWRLPHSTRRQQMFRFVLTAVLVGVNVWDAVHDLRLLRRLDGAR